MGISFSVGNHNPGRQQLQKRLLKHFGVSPREIATAARQFPVTSRIDIQSGLEELLKQDGGTELVGLVSSNPNEASTFAQLLGSPHFFVQAGPLQYEDIDIGDAAPARCLKNALWIGRRRGLPFAVMLVTGGRYGFQAGVGVEIAVAACDAGADSQRISSVSLKTRSEKVEPTGAACSHWRRITIRSVAAARSRCIAWQG